MPPRKPRPPARKKAARPAPKKRKAPVRKAPRRAAAPAGDLLPAAPPAPRDIPWGYVENRITAMARDPHWIFAYWEIRDEAIAEARARLGDPAAGCAIRVYDTTWRQFDGLNPNEFWNVPIGREERGRHLRVGRPGAVFHVDVGVLGAAGGFAPIARSGAVEMPRDSVSPDGRVEWSTVLRSAPVPSYRHRFAAPAGAPPPPAGVPAELDDVFRQFAVEGWSRTEWTETRMDGRVVRWIRWSGPRPAELLSGLPAGAWSRVEILLGAEGRSVRTANEERFVFGPWIVRLEALGPGGERREIERWTVRRQTVIAGGGGRVETSAILLRILGGSRTVVERSGSEERLASAVWGSEEVLRGASEWHWGGATESILSGASETLRAGATEALFGGASEARRIGTSESSWAGASETVLGGASGVFWPGASEERP